METKANLWNFDSFQQVIISVGTHAISEVVQYCGSTGHVGPDET